MSTSNYSMSSTIADLKEGLNVVMVTIDESEEDEMEESSQSSPSFVFDYTFIQDSPPLLKQVQSSACVIDLTTDSSSSPIIDLTSGDSRDGKRKAVDQGNQPPLSPSSSSSALNPIDFASPIHSSGSTVVSTPLTFFAAGTMTFLNGLNRELCIDVMAAIKVVREVQKNYDFDKKRTEYLHCGMSDAATSTAVQT